MSSATYLVTGMTCAHCVAAVTKELEAVEGAEQVEVRLDSARAIVTGPADEGAVVAAVEEAGYSACREL